MCFLMTEKFYLDTSIWIDVYEDRKGFNGEPLGQHGARLLSYIRSVNARIVMTDNLMYELQKYYPTEKIRGMMMFFDDLIERVIANAAQKEEAKNTALERDLPYHDVLHAVVARDMDAVLITRDRHFIRLKDISEPHTPEDLLP